MEKERRFADEFINNRGVLLRDKGFQTDKQEIEHTQNSNIVFYHYTREDHLEQVLSNGLFAYRPVTCPKLPEDFVGFYLVEGFLEPLPKWLTESVYFGNLGIDMVREYIGNVLLRIEIPVDFQNVYIADYAHILECKHLDARGTSPLELGYKCNTGHETTQAYINSYVSIESYKGGHIAPVVQILRKDKGITVPSKYIKISNIQPLK